MKTETKERLAVAQLAWGGTSGEFEPREGYGHCSISGCGPLARMLAEYGHDGLPVIVAPAEDGPNRSKWIAASIGGPMLNPKLAPNEVSRFDGKGTIVFEAMVSAHNEGIHNSFTNLAKMAEDEKFSGLDEVGIDLFLAVKRAGGARIGRMNGHCVDWEDGTSTPIPEEAWQETPASWWPFWDWDKSIIPQ